ncbi:hypothetical protein [Heyndrickxia acidicola]|uniref:Uncharacterized protein n=1 Tax=Heyndrickxia acidicola TaxID=209389 RepID=A0ABU6MH63_9BACI|nr:hypothetical protein [Heyndrickxia acidicola]MED1202380.1 hypothetical protein [Heyndrickxia acidicola]
MDQKAFFYDGSFHVEETSNEETVTPSPFPITDEVRKNLAANPFSF